MQLDRESGGPALYRQIADRVRDHIVNNGLTVGDPLPSEPELRQRFDVSRATVTKALDTLAQEGLIVRKQGTGTFVALPPLVRQLPELTSFTEHVQSLGRRGGQRLISYARVSEPAHDPLLGACFREPAVLVQRVRLVDADPVGIHRTGLPLALAEQIGFTRDRLEGEGVSLYRLFEEHGVQLASAEEHLQAVTATSEQAELLGVAEGTALMQVRRFTRDTDGRLVEAVDARYIGHVYDYRIDLTRTRSLGSDREGKNGQNSLGAGERGGPRIDGRGVRR